MVVFQVLSEARHAADLICPEVHGQLEPDGEPYPSRMLLVLAPWLSLPASKMMMACRCR